MREKRGIPAFFVLTKIRAAVTMLGNRKKGNEK